MIATIHADALVSQSILIGHGESDMSKSIPSNMMREGESTFMRRIFFQAMKGETLRVGGAEGIQTRRQHPRGS